MLRVLVAIVAMGLVAYSARDRLLFGIVNALASRGAAVTEGIAYGPDKRQKLDVYVPTTDDRPAAASRSARSVLPAGAGAGSAHLPIVVFFYGGSWNSGRRSDYRFVGEALASQGFIAIVPDYRVYPTVRYPDFLRDCAQSVAWALRRAASLGGDPQRVFVMGHSAGGYNAAMLALDPRWLEEAGTSPNHLAGFIGLAGPYDFLPTDLPDVRPVFHHPDYPPAAQPVDHVSASAPPTFIAAGIDDRVVSPTRSTRQLADRLRGVGADVTVRFYPHVGHLALLGAVIPALQWMAPVLDDVAAFVRRK